MNDVLRRNPGAGRRLGPSVTVLMVVCMAAGCAHAGRQRGTAVGDSRSGPFTPVLIEQVRDSAGNGVWVERGAGRYGLYRILPPGDARQAAFRQMMDANPAVATEFELVEAARRLVAADSSAPDGLDARSWRTALADPLYISVDGDLTNNQWQGLVIRTDKGDEDHLFTVFVCATGDFDDIRAASYVPLVLHETGHAIFHIASLRWSARPWNLLCSGQVNEANLTSIVRYRGGPLHDIQSTSFSFNAVDEGFAETMDAVADISRRVVDSEGWKIGCYRSVEVAGRYVSRPDRTTLIMDNRLIFEPPLPAAGPDYPSPPMEGADALDAEMLAYRHAMPVDNHRLRSCGPQLSTEGVVASIFTRLALNPVLQQATFPGALVKVAVPPGQDESGWLDSLGPGARVLLRLIVALAAMNDLETAYGTPGTGIRQVLSAWDRVFPDDFPTLASTIVSTTLGATVSTDLSGRIRRMLAGAQPGINSPQDKAAFESLSAELEAAASGVSDVSGLFAACGPELWVRIPDRMLCSRYRCLPFEVDLNAAEEMDFRFFPGVTKARAHELVEIRDSVGSFSSLDDFCRQAGMLAKDASSIIAL